MRFFKNLSLSAATAGFVVVLAVAVSLALLLLPALVLAPFGAAALAIQHAGRRAGPATTFHRTPT